MPQALALASIVQHEQMPDLNDRRIFYEQPLSERIRAFLRLEFLFNRAEFQLQTDDPWASRGAMESIIDVLAVMSRSDLKKELLKELERQCATLEALASNPNVDERRLEFTLDQVRRVRGTLYEGENIPGIELRDNELLSMVRQRSSIPAGTCAFDLPGYHYWLQRPAHRRMQDLREWLSKFDRLREAISLSLKLVRESAGPTPEIAHGGFYKKTLEASAHCQMIRVALSPDAECYPEISAGRHRFTVRFMHPVQGSARPTQVEEDVKFQLLCCLL